MKQQNTHKEVSLRNAWTSFSRNFVTTRYVNYINYIVCQFSAEVRSQIVCTPKKGTKNQSNSQQSLSNRNHLLADNFLPDNVTILTRELPPPDSQRSISALYKFESSSRGPRLMLISSLIAACGQPPVSTARILSSGRAPCFIKNSPSSFVNISFVTYKIESTKIHIIPYQNLPTAIHFICLSMIAITA